LHMAKKEGKWPHLAQLVERRVKLSPSGTSASSSGETRANTSKQPSGLPLSVHGCICFVSFHTDLHAYPLWYSGLETWGHVAKKWFTDKPRGAVLIRVSSELD
jgi:hypothetical protein